MVPRNEEGARSGKDDGERWLRIGLIVPTVNTAIEPDFWRFAPKGITIHSARMSIVEASAAALAKMNVDAERAAKELAEAKVDLIVYGCTTGSCLGGLDYDKKLAAQLSELTGIPVVTTSTAVVEALNELKVKKVSVATAYSDELNSLLLSFLEANGFQVLALEGMQIRIGHEFSAQSPATGYEMAKKVDRPEAEGIFLSCTAWRVVEVIHRLERELGKPVVSSNQATFWAALRRLNITQPIQGYGRLLQSITPMPT